MLRWTVYKFYAAFYGNVAPVDIWRHSPDDIQQFLETMYTNRKNEDV